MEFGRSQFQDGSGQMAQKNTRWVPENLRRRRDRPKKCWHDNLDSFLAECPEKAKHGQCKKAMKQAFVQQKDNRG